MSSDSDLFFKPEEISAAKGKSAHGTDPKWAEEYVIAKLNQYLGIHLKRKAAGYDEGLKIRLEVKTKKNDSKTEEITRHPHDNLYIFVNLFADRPCEVIYDCFFLFGETCNMVHMKLLKQFVDRLRDSIRGSRSMSESIDFLSIQRSLWNRKKLFTSNQLDAISKQLAEFTQLINEIRTYQTPDESLSNSESQEAICDSS